MIDGFEKKKDLIVLYIMSTFCDQYYSFGTADVIFI